MSTDRATVSWSHTPAESRLLRACVSLPAGVVAAAGLVIVVGTVGLALLLFVRGNYALGAALVVAIGVSAARIAPLHYARLRGGLSPASEFRGLRPRWIAAGAVVGVTAFAVGAQFGTVGVAGAFAATALLPVMLAAVLASEGELRADGTLTYRGSDLDLAAVEGVRRLAVGGYVAYRLSYAPGGATFSTPRTIVVPRAVAPDVGEAVERGVAADPPESESSKRAVRLAAGALGVSFLGFAGFLLTVDPTSAHPRARGALWYAALVTAGFGVLFVGVGLRGG